MKLTIAFDDVSLPLPKMRRPDIRQRVIEAVLDLAADAGVDDVHLIAALALHRRMTEAELRHAVGDRVYDAFAPRGLLYNHDAEDPDNLAFLGTTPHGEEVEINKRAAESDLLVYVNINLVAMDGGWKSTATGLARYRSLRHHHNVRRRCRHSQLFMDQHTLRAAQAQLAHGQGASRDAGVEGLPDRDDAEHRHLPAAVRLPGQAGVGVDGHATGRPTSPRPSRCKRTPTRLARKIFHVIEAPHQMTSVQAGEVEAVHQLTTENVYQPAARRGARGRPTSSRWASRTSARTTSTRS